MRLEDFDKIWSIDFEFKNNEYGLPDPICLVGKEIISGEIIRLIGSELTNLKCHPFGKDLILAYYASAEMSCYLSLGWEMPEFLVDLFVEFRVATNQNPYISKNSLIGALKYYGHEWVSEEVKESYRQLAMRGGPYSEAEEAGLLDYCETDVLGAEIILSNLKKDLDLNGALYRGEYIKIVSKIEKKWDPG